MNWVIDDPFNRVLPLGGIFDIGEGGRSLKIAIIPRNSPNLWGIRKFTNMFFRATQIASTNRSFSQQNFG